MARAGAASGAPFLTQRMVEWSILFLVVLTLVLVFLHRARRVQAQGEYAAVQSTLAALRTGLVHDSLVHQARARQAGGVRNPFDSLKTLPINYLGELPMRDVVPRLRQGYWAYAPDCPCVVYAPRDTEWFDSPSGDTMLWYRVTHFGQAPLTLEPQEAYRWHGETML